MFSTTGCVHIRDLDTSNEIAIADINERAVENTAKITFTGGESITVEQLKIGHDSTSWKTIEGRNLNRAPTSAITAVQFISRNKAGINSVIIGALLGGAVVAIPALISGEDNELASRDFLIAISAGIGVVAGGLIGALTMIPSKKVYRIKNAELPGEEREK